MQKYFVFIIGGDETHNDAIASVSVAIHSACRRGVLRVPLLDVWSTKMVHYRLLFDC